MSPRKRGIPYLPNPVCCGIGIAQAGGMMTSGATTVLVVDDSSVICEVIRTVLEPVGYCVLSATDSFEALEACRRYPAPIDLLLTDVIMPGMDGRELASSVEGLRPSTRVLFMSGEVPAGDLQPSKPFLAKPWGPVDLLRKVEQTLSS